MDEVPVRENRLEWIDWMKALGIFLIVLGHFNSVGNQFVYVFHVPLFFLISGFLCKREDDIRLFWKKLWYNLAVPMLILATLNYLYYCGMKLSSGTFEPVFVYWFVRNVVFGMVSGFGPLWFVYTLILLKVIFQFCRSEKLLYSLTFPLLGLAYIYNNNDLSASPFFLRNPNAFVNVCIAFPFFALGIFLRKYKTMLDKELNNKLVLALAFLCGLSLVIGCCFMNGLVAAFRCDYGGNMLWFLLGGIAGTMMVFALSKLLGHAPGAVIVISRGTMIILGFHMNFVLWIQERCTESYMDVVYAVLIVIVLVPVIMLTEKYFPLMAGKYRVNKSNVGKIKG